MGLGFPGFVLNRKLLNWSNMSILKKSIQTRDVLSFIPRDIKLVCCSISCGVFEMKANWANVYSVSSESKSLETVPLSTLQCYDLPVLLCHSGLCSKWYN